jgi:hypothetical protein
VSPALAVKLYQSVSTVPVGLRVPVIQPEAGRVESRLLLWC